MPVPATTVKSARKNLKSLVREVNYFPDASSAHEWLVLIAWIVAGIRLSLLGHHRSTTPLHLPQGELEHAAGAHRAR